MALIVRTAPQTTALTTVGRVLAELQLRAADPLLYPVLGGLIARASSAIAHECGRPFFGVGTYTETLRGSGSQLLPLLCVPILRIAAIYQDDELLAPIDPTDPADPNLEDGYYVEDAEAGAVYRPAGWGQTVALLSWGSQAYSSRYILPGGTSTLRYSVTYTAGYVLPGDPGGAQDVPVGEPAPTLPGAIEEACLVTVKAWWLARSRDPAVLELRTADQQVRYGAPSQDYALPAPACAQLRNYRRVN